MPLRLTNQNVSKNITIVQNEGKSYELALDYDQSMEDPRDSTGGSILCFREHRRMSFPNEIDFDFDRYDELTDIDEPTKFDEEELKSMTDFGTGHMFWIDVYEHGGFAFSLSGTGMQCQFDTSRAAGFIFIEEEDYAKAEAIARCQIRDYEAYVNGEGMIVDVSQIVPLYFKDGSESKKYEKDYLETYAFLPENAEQDLPEWIYEAIKGKL